MFRDVLVHDLCVYNFVELNNTVVSCGKDATVAVSNLLPDGLKVLISPPEVGSRSPLRMQ